MTRITRIFLIIIPDHTLMKKSKEVFDEPKGRIKVIIYLRYPRHPRLKNEKKAF